SIAGLVQVIIAIWMLRRRLGGLELPQTLLSFGRFALAAIPAGLAGWGAYVLLGGADGWAVAGEGMLGRVSGAVGTGVIGGVTFLVYLAALFLLRAPELGVVSGLIRRFLPTR